MELLLLLALAHFLGDYPLQTNWVYAKKLQGWFGGIFHAGGILLGLIICLAPFLNRLEIWIAIISTFLVHYGQDQLKVMWNKKHNSEKLSYCIDQLFHVSFLTLLWYFFLRNEKFYPLFGEVVYTNATLLLFLIGLVLVTYVFEITKFLWSGEKRYIRNWKMMKWNAGVYCLVWGIFFLTQFLLSN